MVDKKIDLKLNKINTYLNEPLFNNYVQIKEFSANMLNLHSNILVSSHSSVYSEELINKLLLAFVSQLKTNHMVIVLSENKFYNFDSELNVVYVLDNFGAYIDNLIKIIANQKLQGVYTHYFIIYNTIGNVHHINSNVWIEKIISKTKYISITNIFDEPFFVEYSQDIQKSFNYVFMFNRISGLTKKKMHELYFSHIQSFNDFNKVLESYCKINKDKIIKFLFKNIVDECIYYGSVDKIDIDVINTICNDKQYDVLKEIELCNMTVYI
jgi:hypothetical protein